MAMNAVLAIIAGGGQAIVVIYTTRGFLYQTDRKHMV
jgi:hypothetical protein